MKVGAKILLWTVAAAAIFRGAVLIYGFIKDAAVDAPSDIPKVWGWFSVFPQETIILLVIAAAAGAVATYESWWPALKSLAGQDQHRSSIRVTRTAFDETQSINVLPSSLGGRHLLRLGNLATLRLGGSYSLETVTLRLDVTPVRLPDRKTENMAVEDFTITKGDAAEYTFDTTKNNRHEIPVVGRTYVVTLLEARKLDTPNVSNPIQWEFGITEK